jgi:DNA-binding CsgD family transcriptional regulator
LRQKQEGRAERAGMDDSDAVFDARGRLQHLGAGLDTRHDRRALTTSVDRLREAHRVRRLDDGAALELWRALVDGRWSIVRHADTDGKRYLLARKNAPKLPEVDAGLTQREALAAAYAALGHSSKLVAYELGISESSVSVLLKRAMRKLGAKSRAELALLFGPAVAPLQGGNRRGEHDCE